MTLLRFFSIFLCLLYGFVLWGYVQRFRGKPARRPRLAKALPVATLLIHFGFLLCRMLRTEGAFINSFSGSLSLLAFTLAFSYFLIEWATRERNMGLWIMALPFVFQIIATTQTHSQGAAEALPHTPIRIVHIAAALVGFCALSLSAAFSSMYLLQYRQIKSHRLGLIFERLPSLEKLENMGYRAVHFGLGFLLVGVILGEWLFYQEEGRIVLADAKIIVAVIACVIYGSAILLRYRLSIQGKRFAIISIVGFGMVLFSLFIVDQFLPSFHSF